MALLLPRNCPVESRYCCPTLSFRRVDGGPDWLEEIPQAQFTSTLSGMFSISGVFAMESGGGLYWPRTLPNRGRFWTDTVPASSLESVGGADRILGPVGGRVKPSLAMPAGVETDRAWELLLLLATLHFSVPEGPLNVSAGGRGFGSLAESRSAEVSALVFGRGVWPSCL